MPLQASKASVAHPRQEYVTLDAETLLRRLVEQLLFAAQPARLLRNTAEVVEEVVFEGTVDGTRYYVVRSQPQKPTDQVSLSPRELAIARLIAKGMPNKCIGDILEISQWTVATHLRRIFTKLNVTSRAAMVAQLVEADLLAE